MVTQEKLASPLKYDTHFTAYWSPYARDVAFGANTDVFGTKFTGFSFCHPAHDDKFIYNLVKHALSSVANTDIPTSFHAPPHLDGMDRERLHALVSSYPDHATILAKFPSESLTFQPSQVHLPLSTSKNKI
eukprot:1142053-Pelagomonas_calceolata.AAC.2